MSRYIRTKDEIYDLESKEVSSWEYIDNDTARDIYGVDGAFYTIYYFDENKGHYSEYDNKGGHSCDFIEEKDILKKSDTKEELCDEFVFVNKVGNFDKSYVIHYDIPNRIFTEPTIEEKIAYIKKYYKDELDKIRGAIYTDEGLIYVAKMDSEGNLS